MYLYIEEQQKTSTKTLDIAACSAKEMMWTVSKEHELLSPH